MTNVWANIIDRITNVFFGERKARAREELEKLKAERKEVMSKPSNAKCILRVLAIDKRIDELNIYLGNR